MELRKTIVMHVHIRCPPQDQRINQHSLSHSRPHPSKPNSSKGGGEVRHQGPHRWYFDTHKVHFCNWASAILPIKIFVAEFWRMNYIVLAVRGNARQFCLITQSIHTLGYSPDVIYLLLLPPPCWMAYVCMEGTQTCFCNDATAFASINSRTEAIDTTAASEASRCWH